jgi:hypothetical protein
MEKSEIVYKEVKSKEIVSMPEKESEPIQGSLTDRKRNYCDAEKVFDKNLERKLDNGVFLQWCFDPTKNPFPIEETFSNQVSKAIKYMKVEKLQLASENAENKAQGVIVMLPALICLPLGKVQTDAVLVDVSCMLGSDRSKFNVSHAEKDVLAGWLSFRDFDSGKKTFVWAEILIVMEEQKLLPEEKVQVCSSFMLPYSTENMVNVIGLRHQWRWKDLYGGKTWQMNLVRRRRIAKLGTLQLGSKAEIAGYRSYTGPNSQAWFAIIFAGIRVFPKSAQPKRGQVKTQIDQSKQYFAGLNADEIRPLKRQHQMNFVVLMYKWNWKYRRKRV